MTASGRRLRGSYDTLPSGATAFAVIDPFAGSCNSLYWILRYVRDARGIAFELDPSAFAMTKHTVASLDGRAILDPVSIKISILCSVHNFCHSA